MHAHAPKLCHFPSVILYPFIKDREQGRQRPCHLAPISLPSGPASCRLHGLSTCRRQLQGILLHPPVPTPVQHSSIEIHHDTNPTKADALDSSTCIAVARGKARSRAPDQVPPGLNRPRIRGGAFQNKPTFLDRIVAPAEHAL